jgi:predicted PurR-regulated permease PerM
MWVLQMKTYIRRFVDWMENGPMILTIWFLPILLLLAYPIALFINSRKEPMTTIPKTKANALFNLRMRFAEFKHHMRSRKKDPTWSRVDEPDNIIPSFMILIFGMVMSAFSMMFVYAFMTGAIETWIAQFLAAQHSTQSFNELYAAFTASLVFLIDFVILFAISLFRVADGDDIVEMISDLDANTQERIVELEQTIDARLLKIENEAGININVSEDLAVERLNKVAS